MRIEAIGDVVHWARQHHGKLSALLRSAGERSADDERARLLLAYLSEHEEKLSGLLEHVEHSGDAKALHTYCYDFLDAAPFEPHPAADAPWTGLDPVEIVARIEHEHAQLVALYRHLRRQVDGVAAQELLDELIELERHEAMRIAQGANRFRDY